MSVHREQDEERCQWLDLRALRQYACVSDRTLREWIHRPIDPLPAVRVGTKILIRRSCFDSWLEAHKLRRIDVEIILKEMITSSRRKAK